MAAVTAKINVKNMDYFKFKKIVIDGSRDDYESCSREIRALCDAVQTLSFRDEQFADEDDDHDDSLSSSSSCGVSDRRHLDEILTGYRLILTGKRVDPVDIRVKTGWWADTVGSAASACGSAGKFKSSALRETLLKKTADWRSRHGTAGVSDGDQLDRPGVFVLKHRERQCFQYVGRTCGQRGGVFAACTDLLKSTFDGTLAEPIAALLVVSMVADWDFYYLPLDEHDDDRMLRIVMNDVIIRHDALWPRGLNELLYLQTPLEVAQLRLSCLRHRWPPVDADLPPCDAQLNLIRLRTRLQRSPPSVASSPGNEATGGATATKKGGAATHRTGPAATSSPPQTSPTKSTQHQSTKPSVPSRPATMTKSTTATSPTKSPHSRPQSAPRPPPPTTASSRPPQPSAGTTQPRPKSARSVTAAGGGSKPRSSATGRVAAATAETELTNTSDTTSSMNGHTQSSCQQPGDGDHTSATETSDVVINTLQNEPCDLSATAIDFQQVSATV